MALLKQSPLEPLFDRLGNANPQLLRELRGRLKPGPVLGTLVVSIAGQVLYILSRLSQLPNPTPATAELTNGVYRHIYCLATNLSSKEQFLASKGQFLSTPACSLAGQGSGNWLINWPLWWADALTNLHLTVLPIVVVLSCYFLVADWSREDERGTLNPLRLSPQSTTSILWGKLLGGPLLAYGFGLSTVPLQLTAMVGAGRSTIDILSMALINLAQLSFWGMTSLFVANLLGPIGRGAKAILAAIVTSIALVCSVQVASVSGLGQDYGLHGLLGLISPALGLNHDGGGIAAPSIGSLLMNVGGWSLFGWHFGRSTPSLALGVSVILGAWSYACWLAVRRRFDRPAATLWNKAQSYGITAAVTAFVLGAFRFDLRGYGIGTEQAVADLMMQRMDWESKFDIGNRGSDIIHSLLPLFWLMLPLGLSLVQPRQALIDGLRRPVSESRSARQTNLRLDRIWGEFSPPFLALGLQLAIACTAICLFWVAKLQGLPIAPLGSISLNHHPLWGALLLVNLWLLLIGLAQLIALKAQRRAALWISIAIAAGLLALPIGLGLLGQQADTPLWLLTVYPFTALQNNDGLGLIIAALGTQWLGLALIYHQFDRGLRTLSRSDLAQALMPSSGITTGDAARL
jgi:ABC-type transport system involved in multi-copper enzyme maturation permease subunit